MQITIELKPGPRAVLQKGADARGLPINDYLQSLVDELADPSRGKGTLLPHGLGASLEEFERDWAAFSEPIAGLPPIADADLSREAIYGDHD